ncbi:MAG: hypothetical protein M3T96_06755 [Acidobacteriota bacterium]|nr:hypothetical protein [Acidobacteriota bacterium]
MIFLIIAVIFGIIVFIYANSSLDFNILSPKLSEEPPEFHNAELVKILLSLDKESLDELFKLYKSKFGRGAAYYARRTYVKWKTGRVRPNNQTYQRFLVQLPKVMSYNLKCEVLRKLMQEYCPKDDYQLTVSANDWEEKITPLVKTMIDKPYAATLPRLIEEKLRWLAEDEMQSAQEILRNSQIQEGKIAVSMLRREISEIENLLGKAKGETTVTHSLKLPYGTIKLKIKRK